MNIIETIISTVIGIILSVFAWIIKRLYAQVDNMEIKMRELEIDQAKKDTSDKVLKEFIDFRLNELKEMLKEIKEDQRPIRKQNG